METYFNDFSDYNYILNVHVPSVQHGICALIKKI